MDFALYAATRVLVDLQIFRQLSKSNGPLTATQLAETSNADPELVSRLLKHVAVENLITETGPDEYTANDLTHLIASADGEGVIKDMANCIKTMEYLPEYFEKNGYANPISKDTSAWSQVMGSHYFEWMFQPGREDKIEAFNHHMSFKTLGKKWYEVPEIMEGVFGSGVGSDLGKEDVLMVDVGGSTGHDILGFSKAHPNISGRLILQDLAGNIESADTKTLTAHKIEPMAHDFFTPQPVQAAKAYYLKMVLHDWPDEQCKQILTRTRDAMKPGYSVIMLNENVIPDVGATWFETSLDMLMMAVHGAQERKESEWRALIESVGGLEVKKVWEIEGVVEKVVEIERTS